TGTIVNQITGKQEQYIPMTCYVVSPFGCQETINLKARILDKIRMANVFSPNGDGINDLWRVPYADIFPSLEITIVNRWGAVVWSARASDASAGWDGKNKNGKDLPTGTYYYVISFNVPGSNHWKPISGSVTIVR
ncbi:MAG TPA: gliding motility-associated C-terminal domain-containing protein, partial [Tenuifilaceae bacterium]|nr:gliding motility-associated C-terminal domain-containing protein [Tenuifilaceae bacterium]